MYKLIRKFRRIRNNIDHFIINLKYPFLRVYGPYNKIYWDISYWTSIPDGWRLAFGKEMCDEIKAVLKKGHYLHKYRICQIKEKYGGLRWYDLGAPEEIYDELQQIIDKYEILSYETCIECGKPSTHMTKGWITPLCDTCDKDSSL